MRGSSEDLLLRGVEVFHPTQGIRTDLRSGGGKDMSTEPEKRGRD